MISLDYKMFMCYTLRAKFTKGGKNMIQVSGFKQTTKNYTRIFSPTISKDKWMISQISESEHSSSTIKYLFGEILQQIHDQESLNELSDFIEKQKKRIEKNRRGQTD